MKFALLREFAFDGSDEVGALYIHRILCFKKRAAFLAPLCLQCLDLFLAGELFLQCQRAGGCPTGLPDLPSPAVASGVSRRR